MTRDTDEFVALRVLADVTERLIDASPRFKRMIDRHPTSISSSYLRPNWNHKSPFHVLVYTEYGPIEDPYYDPETKQALDRTTAVLRAMPWYADAGWDSVTAGVVLIWVKPELMA